MTHDIATIPVASDHLRHHGDQDWPPCREYDIANSVGHGIAESREVTLRLFLDGAKRNVTGLLALVCLAAFLYLIDYFARFLRWYFRLLIWTRFLWQVSRIKLRLVPIHSDRAGGLGFLSRATYAFAPLLAGQGAIFAGVMANKVFYAGAKLTRLQVGPPRDGDNVASFSFALIRVR